MSQIWHVSNFDIHDKPKPLHPRYEGCKQILITFGINVSEKLSS